MIDEEQARFENNLRRITPARVPSEFMDRLRAAKISGRPARRPPPQKNSGFAEWRAGWRWLVTAAPVAVAVALFVRMQMRPGEDSTGVTGLKANAVEVDHNLVSSFDAVAQLPGGEPVRFRCRKWIDEVVMSDKSRGMVIEQRNPRLEVIPVGFETY